MKPTKKHIFIIGGIIIAALVVVGLAHQNLTLFGVKKPSAARGTEASPPSGGEASVHATNAQKPYTIEIVPLDEIPPYRGVSVGIVNESEASKKITPSASREKLTAKLAAAAALIAKNSDNFDAWIEIGSVKHALGDEIGARDAWEYAGIIRPQNTTSFFNLGNLYGYYLNDTVKAEWNFQAVMRNDPNYVAGYLALVAFYRDVATEKYPQEAEKILLAGEKALPLDLNIVKSLAFLYKNSGNTEKAIAYFEKYLAIDPLNDAIRGELNALLRVKR